MLYHLYPRDIIANANLPNNISFFEILKCSQKYEQAMDRLNSEFIQMKKLISR